MGRNKGFVIAFHCDQGKYPYLGLTCKDRALRTVKPYIPGEIASALATLKGKEDFDGLLRRISLEAGIVKEDKAVFDFVHRKVEKGEPIFLDLTEDHVDSHNAGPYVQSHFVIVSVRVTNSTFHVVNHWLFTPEELRQIVLIVSDSQGGLLNYKPHVIQSQSLSVGNCDPDCEDKDSADRGVSEDDDPRDAPFLGSFPFATLGRKV
jgi:hypothetical protein